MPGSVGQAVELGRAAALEQMANQFRIQQFQAPVGLWRVGCLVISVLFLAALIWPRRSSYTSIETSIELSRELEEPEETEALMVVA